MIQTNFEIAIVIRAHMDYRHRSHTSVQHTLTLVCWIIMIPDCYISSPKNWSPKAQGEQRAAMFLEPNPNAQLLSSWELCIPGQSQSSQCKAMMFKIEVFDAFQMRFGPSKYTSLKTNPSKRNPKLNMKTSLEVLGIMCPPQEPTSVGYCHYKWI
jgi:hypothetical protein